MGVLFNIISTLWKPRGMEHIAWIQLPRERIEAIAFGGLEPEHIERVRIRVNGVECFNFGPGFDANYNPITGGQAIKNRWDYMESGPLTEGRLGLRIGADLRRAADVLLEVTMAPDAPRGDMLTLKVDCLVQHGGAL